MEYGKQIGSAFVARGIPLRRQGRAVGYFPPALTAPFPIADTESPPVKKGSQRAGEPGG